VEAAGADAAGGKGQLLSSLSDAPSLSGPSRGVSGLYIISTIKVPDTQMLCAPKNEKFLPCWVLSAFDTWPAQSIDQHSKGWFLVKNEYIITVTAQDWYAAYNNGCAIV
jgi:hypothetical protein